MSSVTSAHAVVTTGQERGRVRRFLSSVPFLGMHLACGLAFVYPPTWPLAMLAVASYLLRMWAITVGYHRYLSHRAFRTSRTFQFVLAALGATAMQQGPLWWASWHRRHHRYVDTPADPHSPVVRGFWHAHVGWVFDGLHDGADLSNLRDLTRFPELRVLDRYSYLPLVIYGAVCFAIAGMPGVVWGFVVSTIAVAHATFLINSLAHVWGTRRWATRDGSRNNAALALLTLGEGWHNNHHHHMSAARQGFAWWEVDVSWYSIRLLRVLGLVWDVRSGPAVVSASRAVPGPVPGAGGEPVTALRRRADESGEPTATRRRGARRPCPRGAGAWLATLVVLAPLAASRAHASPPGDLVAADGTLLFRVDAVTGTRTVLSDFHDPAQGPVGSSFDVAPGPGGTVYVTDGASDESGKLFQVSADGTRTVRSDATDPTQGDPWHTPHGVFVDQDGSILVSDRGMGGGGNSAGLWRTGPTDGVRVKLADFGGAPEGVALDADGHIVLGDAEGGTDCHTFGGCGSLAQVDGVTGARTLLADFGNLAQGPLGEDAGLALALDTDGTILVTDPFAPPGSASCFDTGGCGVVFRWDPVSHTRAYLTTYADAAQGAVSGFRPKGVAVKADGTIFVSPCPGSADRGAICTVDRVTGLRTTFSDFGDPAQGPLGFQPTSLAIVDFAATTTSSTTTTTTTSTTLPNECGERAATFPSIVCRLEKLAARVQSAQDLGRLRRGLVGAVTRSLAKAHEAQTRADGGDTRKARKSLAKAAYALRGFVHKVKSSSGRKVLPPSTRSAIERDRLTDVLSVVRDRTGFDFGSYKHGTLERRIGRRMGLRHVAGVEQYVRLLIDDPVEVDALLGDLLISVTSFFRDPEAWRFLQERVIRPLVAHKPPHSRLRVWVPGCATGEEAYSVAMLCREEIERAHTDVSLQVFASDVDTRALAVARAGLYPASIAGEVSPERLRRFFVATDHGPRVGKTLRESVTFARHDVLVDPPFSTIDLVSLRNIVMYFDLDAQTKVISLLHFALVENGILFLGSAETPGGHEDLFEPISRKWRIYRRVGPPRHGRYAAPLRTPLAGRPLGAPSSAPPGAARLEARAQRLLLQRFVPACVLINAKGEIVYFGKATQDYLLQPAGVPTPDLMSRVRPGLRSNLRAAISRAAHGRGAVVTRARVRRGETLHPVTMTVEALEGGGADGGFLLVSFADDGRGAPDGPTAADPTAGGEGATSSPQLEDELETMREDLHGSIEEREISNQELRAANDEVMSVNEELRSVNEELETSKEELQSLNEELTTVNTQLEEKVVQLERAHDDLDNLLTSTNVATIFLDTDLRVRRFTPAATRLFDLTSAATGRRLADVGWHCTDPDLLRDAGTVLGDPAAISKEVQGRDGRWYVRQVLPYRTQTKRIDGVVITFSDVAAEALQEARLYAEAIVDTVREPLLVLGPDLRVQSANRAFYRTFQLTPESTVDRSVYELGNRELDVPRVRTLLGEVLRDGGMLTGFELEHDFAKIGRRVMLLNARILTRGGGRPNLILLAIEDVTERASAERALRASEAMTRAGVRTAVDGIITTDEHGTILSFNPAAERIFGYGEAEMIGESVGRLVPAQHRDEYDGWIAEHLRSEKRKIVGREVCGRRKDGTSVPLDLTVSEFDDVAGRRFVGTMRDITERKRTEERGQQKQAELAHVLRVATIERLAAGLAHELNQPLTAIANDVEACASYLRSEERDPARLLTLLERAGAEALRAGDIVHHLRDFVRRSDPQLESADLRELIGAATRWLARDMEQAGITLRLDMPAGPLRVRVDRIQIEQVLVNLLQNAVDAIREADGEVREIRVRASPCGDGTAEVAIEDTGAGLRAPAVERLYEPFFTTKPEGMGMGLAISQTIVEMHQGRLSVAARTSGPGTTARVALPLESSA
jgi:two-component system CheB/CheR fusion protein